MRSRPRLLTTLGALLGACICACTGTDVAESKQEEAMRLLAQGRQQIAEMKLREAIVSLRMVLHRDISNVDAIAGLAEVYRIQQRVGAADGYQRKVIFETYSEGMRLLEANEEAAAIKAFKHAVELHPAHTLALIELGKLATKNGGGSAAVAYFELAREANPLYAQGRIILGEAYLAGGRYGDARKEYEQALQINANAFGAHVGLAHALAGERLWPEAVRQFEKALLLNPASEDAKSGLQRVRSQM